MTETTVGAGDPSDPVASHEANYVVKRVNLPILQVSVTPLDKLGLLSVLSRRLTSGVPTLIGAHNLHSVYLFQTTEQFRLFYECCDVVLIDGWPVLSALNRTFATKGSPRHSSALRIGSTDWIPEAFAMPEVERVAVLGAREPSNSQFVDRFSLKYPKVTFLGIPGHPWETAQADAVMAKIRDFEPDITLVGMGMPLQENLALIARACEVPGVIATVGGAIDQLSGVQSNSPRWLGQYRVEWMWRLATNPRRLSYRYLVEPIKLLALLQKGGRAR